MGKALLFFFLTLLAFPANAGQFLFAEGGGSPPVYSGWGDVQTATDYYALRAYTASIAAAGTQTLLNVTNTSTSESCDILVASNGGFGLTSGCSGSSSGTSPATFCSTNCVANTIYDQAGSNNLSASGAQRPSLVFGCTSLGAGLPCLHFISGSSQTFAGTWATGSAPYNFSFVARRTTFTVSNVAVMGNLNTAQLGFGSADNIFIYAGGTLHNQSATDNVWHCAQGTYSATAGIPAINVDGTDNTTFTNPGSGAISNSANHTAIFSTGNSGGFPTGDFTEAAYNGGNPGVAETATIRTALCSNQRTYWGF